MIRFQPSTYTVLIGIACFCNSLGANDFITVFTEPYRSIDVAAAEPGVLEELSVRQGRFIAAGQPVAALNQDVLKSTLKIARMRAETKAPLQRAMAEVRQKTRRHEKLLELHQNGHASDEELDSAQTALEIAQADLLDAQEKQQLARLQVEEISAQLRRRTIFSPVDGQIVKLHKNKGEYVASLEPVVATIVQLDKLKVKFYLDTVAARQIEQDSQVSVFFPTTNQRTEGTVEFVSPTTDADSGTVRVEVVIENRNGDYRSGVPVRLAATEQARRHTHHTQR